MKKKTRMKSDNFRLLLIGFTVSALYGTIESILGTSDKQTIIAIATIMGYCMITQFLINNVKKSQARIKENEKKYRLLAENATDIIWTMDQNLAFTYFSPSVYAVTGYRVHEIMKLSLKDILSAESLKKTKKLLSDNVVQASEAEKRKTLKLEFQQKRKDGSFFWADTRSVFILDKAGQVTTIQCVSRDITRRKTAEDSLKKYSENLESMVADRVKELHNLNLQLNEEIVTRRKTEEKAQRSESKYRAIFENTGAATIIIDKERVISLANSEFEHITGYTKNEIEGKKAWLEFIDMNNMERLLKKTEFSQDLEHQKRIINSLECNLIDKFGKKRNILLSYASIQGSCESVISLSDITGLKEAEKQIYHQAFHDSLTNLPNRQLFMDHLNMAIKRSKRINNYHFAVAYLDIDRFKNINDSLGHMAGDSLLIAFVQRIAKSLRDIDTIARFGGDEFAILFENIENRDCAILIIKRIQKTLKEPFKLDTKEVYSTASFGIVLDTDHYEIPENIIRDADAAMYHAKEKGKARFEIFDPKMHEKALFLLQLETDLRKAVDKEQFEVFYQPIVSVSSGMLVGFESLIRWNHPKQGIIMPDVFISIAEETGLIIPIGRWVLKQSCLQLCSWQKQIPTEKPLFVSVNLSGKQFSKQGLAADIKKILDETGLLPSQLKLEITESVIMEDTTAAIDALNYLKDLGIRIVIDDFGTGYSSLSYLQQLPIDTLKVDRSFVLPMKKAATEDRKIVEAIISLAHRLGIEVIAEGVETAEQHSILSDLKCQSAQGYLFAKPLNCQNAGRLVQERTPLHNHSDPKISEQ
ncbi:EAL domain-containing protein [Desulfobacterales bacterium HSG16]|nr:EAL domain-containing protein [Desulfobacterales bacterium HSG16]